MASLFVRSAMRQVEARDSRDPVRIVLLFLLNAARPVTKEEIVAHLRRSGVKMSAVTFQQTILAESRVRNWFIGSDSRGFFLIRNRTDARRMDQFYAARIDAERRHRRLLRQTARASGWEI